MTNRLKSPFHQNVKKVSLFLSRARLPVSPHPSPGNLHYTDTETKLTGKSRSLVKEDEKICKMFKPKGSKGASKKSAYANNITLSEIIMFTEIKEYDQSEDMFVNC